MQYLNLKFGWIMVLFAVSGLVQAGNLTIKVKQEGSQASVSGASVCLGTASDPTQFGARLTNASGEASFAEVPAGRLHVTISKEGFRSHRGEVTKSRTDDSLVYVPLRQGVGGAVCIQAKVKYTEFFERKPQQNSYLLQLYSMKINADAPSTARLTVKLNHRTDGQPTHYRASESPDFSGAEWKDYRSVPSFRLSPGKGMKTVYFQVKKVMGTEGGQITRQSAVVSDSILVR